MNGNLTAKLSKATLKYIELTDHNQDKYIDTQECNKLTAVIFNARETQTNLVAKTEFCAKFCKWWIWSKYINFCSRYEFFCTH